ncbi:MAG TPA: LptF/LptG family permease [Chitinophagaceae bacterium]|nr:LptF/LptG family permease [Chitinophagaceae bacterium]
MLKRIDKYILKNFLLTFIFLMLAFSAIAIVIDYTEKVEDFVNKKVPGSEILLYFRNFIPYILALLFPIFIFVAVIFFTSRLANRSEIVAMLSSGMSFKRFLRPYFIGSGIISLVLLFANHYIIPKANKSRLQFEEKYLWNKSYSKDDNFHMRINPKEYIYLQSYNPESKTGYRFSYERIESTTITKKITADRCVYDSVKKEWKLFDAIERTNEGAKETMNKFPLTSRKINFSPSDLIEKREQKQLMTSPELNRFIKKESEKGSEALTEYYIEKYRRTASPFSAFILSIIGACIASRKVRGGSGIHLAIGLLISAIYILMMQFSTTFAIKGNLQPLIAVWLPNIIFGFVAIYFYRKYSR